MRKLYRAKLPSAQSFFLVYLSELSVLCASYEKYRLEAKIPRSFGPPPLPKGAIGGFSVVALTVAQLIFICCVVAIGK